jgi:hypothetical protein
MDFISKKIIERSQERADELKENRVMNVFFSVSAALTISLCGFLFYFNESRHSEQVAHLEKLLNQAREEIRADTACAWGIKR